MAYESLQVLPCPPDVPTAPGFQTVGKSNVTSNLTHRLNNGGSVGVQFRSDYWVISIRYGELTPDEASGIYPFLVSVAGGYQPFYLKYPGITNPKTGAWDTSTSAKVASGAITQTNSRTITIPAWSTRGGDLSVGDHLKFSNSNKIYYIVGASLTADVKTIILHTEIIEPAKIPTCSLEPNDIKFRVNLMGDAPALNFTTSGLFEPFSISLEENIL